MTDVSFKAFSQVFRFIKHYLAAGNEHRAHSPFVYRLLTEAVYVKNPDPVFQKIEIIRNKLLNDPRMLEVTDLGAGSSFDGKLTKRTVSDIARKFAKSPRHCEFLFRITRHLQPAVMIELGTSLGISAMYQASGNANGKVYTLEGCPQTAEVARENFRMHEFKNIECITGNFNDTLPLLLEKIKSFDYAYIDGNHTLDATLRYYNLLKKHKLKNSLIIFDDIYWSTEMEQAWDRIKSDPEVTIGLDFFQFGMVWFNKDFTKQDFLLKL